MRCASSELGELYKLGKEDKLGVDELGEVCKLGKEDELSVGCSVWLLSSVLASSGAGEGRRGLGVLKVVTVMRCEESHEGCCLTFLDARVLRLSAEAVAKKILKLYAPGTEILAYVSQVHDVVLPEHLVDHESLTLEQRNIVRCPDTEHAEKMIAAIDAVRVQGDSVGGLITFIVRGAPRDLGSPVFDKLEAELAKAIMSLPATKGFEFGSGFAGTFLTGSEHNDEFYIDSTGRIRIKTNRSNEIKVISVGGT
ncbi:hypothetical protein Droror1_Dr00009512 [Drosera rotundifolia]